MNDLKWNEKLQLLIDRNIFPGVIHRCLLFSENPGTGKSSFARSAFDDVETITITSDVFATDLLFSTSLVDGEKGTVTKQDYGPVLRAMTMGIPLLINEIDQANESVRFLLHNVMDDLSLCEVTLPNGKRIKPQPGFAIIATTNRSPECMHEALRDRFDVMVSCEMPTDGILNSFDSLERELLDGVYQPSDDLGFSNDVSVRTMFAFSKIRGRMDSNDYSSANQDVTRFVAGLTFGNNQSTVVDRVAVAMSSTVSDSWDDKTDDDDDDYPSDDYKT